MKRTIQITLELYKESPDFLDKIMGRIYIMEEVKKTGMEAKYIETEKESEDDR